MKSKIKKSILVFSILLIGFINLCNGEKGKLNVPLSADDICPLKTGQKIPKAVLETITGDTFDLNKVVAKKATILIFFRGGWCPYCNMQLEGIGKIEKNLLDLGYQIIAISADKPKKNKETKIRHKAKFLLLSDHKMIVSRAFGLAFKVSDKIVNKYKNSYHIDLEGDSGEKHHLLPVPAVFILKKNGMITFSYVNPNYKVRLDPRLLLAAAKVK